MEASRIWRRLRDALQLGRFLTLVCAVAGSEVAVAQQNLTVPADQVLLLEVSQKNGDVRVGVAMADRQFEIDHPTRTRQPEWIFVGPFTQSTDVTLSLWDDNGRSLDGVDVRQHLVPSEIGSSGQLLNRAGQLYATEKNLAKSLQLYLDAFAGFPSDSLPAGVLELPINALLHARRPGEALSLLNQLPTCEADECLGRQWLRARAYFERDEFEAARDLYAPLVLEAGSISIEAMGAGELRDFAETTANFGFTTVLSGNHDEGLRLIEKAMSLAETTGHPLTVAKVESLAAGLKAFDGDFEESELLLLNATRTFSEFGEYILEAEGLVNLMAAQHLQGKLQTSVNSARRALNLKGFLGGNDTIESSIYTGLAIVYGKLGDFERKRHYELLALNLNRSAGRDWRVHRLMVNVGNSERALGRPESALSYHQKALAFFEDRDEAFRTGTIQYELALDYEALGRLSDAIEAATRSIDINKSGPAFSKRASVEAALGRLLRKQGELRQSARVLRSEWEDGDLDASLKVSVGIELVKTLRAQGMFDAAEDVALSVIALVNEVASGLSGPRLGPYWYSKSYDIFPVLVGLYLDWFEKTQISIYRQFAFEVVEQSAALRSAQEIRALETDQDLDWQLIALADRRAGAKSASDERAAANISYYQALEQAKNLPTSTINLTVTGERPGFEEMRGSLGSHQVYLRYFCPGDEQCYLFLLGQSVFEVFELDGNQIQNLILSLISKIETQSPLGTLTQDLGTELFIPDAFDVDGVDSIIVNADYPVSLVPFAVLDTSGGFKRIEHVVSLTGFSQQEVKPRESGRYDLAVIADPVQVRSESASTTNGAWSLNLADLPFSRVEADTLAELYEDSHARFFLGPEANLVNLLSPEVRQARVLHIASHGYFDPDTPDLLGLALSPPDHIGVKTGFVPLDLLLRYQLDNDLVVISGCETGVGEPLNGFGELSLARGFHAMGAKEVLSTRWKVSDRGSAELMSEFYRQMKLENLDASAALLKAQRKLAAKPRYRHPYYWAGYQLSSLSLR